jgi:GNAT superfamily N-acetyltransferase
MTLIRKSVASDAPEIAAVLRRSITKLCYDDHQGRKDIIEPWLGNKTPESVDTWVGSSDAYCVTAFADSGEIIGFGMLTRSGEVLLLYVDPEYVGVGAGRELLRAIEDKATTWGLAELMLDSTVTAKRFYEHHGYLSNGSCKSRSDGLNCHAMHKRLAT